MHVRLERVPLLSWLPLDWHPSSRRLAGALWANFGAEEGRTRDEFKLIGFEFEGVHGQPSLWLSLLPFLSTWPSS